MRRRTVLIGLISAVLATTAVGCSALALPTPTASPDTVRFEVTQARTDYSSGTLVLRVINEGSESITVSNATLSWPGFAAPAAWPKPTEVTAGRTVDLRTTVPDVACGNTIEPSDAPTLSVTLGSGDPATVTPSDPLGTLPRLHDTECITVRVDRVLTLDTAGPLTIDGSGANAVAVIPLRFTPTGANGSVLIRSVASTPLLAPEDGSDSWPLSVTMDAASAVHEVNLRIRPARCDSHAIAEDKIGTVLVLTVDVDGVTGAYRFAVDDATRAALYGFVKQVCGLP
ncbi:hypothetical protein [Mycetocola zhadangensis]|uniref:DUF4232 domain-containing protein n=1 Tax=Mycetocola zhadangensis TaxID=1164595 RepID=A0A3L7J5T6_9MICO|nr:hypothetical protein [Mycetocola zhadangensis]RLQ85725.1 hypothetical protein D9V28_02315 [Mycetocola zhadangensis]GGE85223.1 hypothetical protein GCM10011313_04580 [Mycetocola zhadangensis]